MAARPAETELDPDDVPAPVGRVLETLARCGHAAFLVGGCVRDLLRGRPVADYDVATAAPAEAVLELFPHAVATGIRHGTVMVPTPAGPVDVTAFRAGPRIEDDLAHRDFTINAMAYDPARGALIDPFEGRSDLEKRRLRAVGAAGDRLAEDPLRALRAARLVACLELAIDPAVEAALPGAVPGFRRVARERVRRELAALLLGPGVGPALALLRRSGLEAGLVPGAAEDAAVVVPRLPPDLELRLAAWLRGTDARAVLRELRFPRRSGERVARLLRAHPVDGGVDPSRDASVRRLIKRVGEENVDGLLALRGAEIDTAGDPGRRQALRAALRDVADAVERVRRAGVLAVHRRDLALDGRAVMQHLGLGPGRHVGEALGFLTERVVEDPARNTPDGLRALLDAWSASRQSGSGP